MFGDISAWMFEYLAGVKPCIEEPGFKHFTVAPAYDIVDQVKMSHEAPDGVISVSFERDNSGKVSGEIVVPVNTTADVVLPDGSMQTVKNGGVVKF